MDCTSYAEFESLISRGNLVPVYRELVSDLETPVSLYLKLRGSGESFLLESVQRGEQVGRYSFIGVDPVQVLTLKGDRVTIRSTRRVTTALLGGRDLFEVLRSWVSPYSAVRVPGLPYFSGGAVGYLSYDVVRQIERLPATAQDDLDLPDAIFLLSDTLVAFDHVKRRTFVIANAHVQDGDGCSATRASYEEAVERIEGIVARLRAPVVEPVQDPQAHYDLTLGVSREQFAGMVRRAKEHIAAGDIFQVVLSQRMTRETGAEPLSIYRALRRLNPSPYLFFLDFGHLQLIGSSPEALVRLEDGVAQLNPIAGTRPRGLDRAADAQLEQELRADPKEQAEHVMLVDLGRNDLGRVCEFGSVQVTEWMQVEKYSHVMHLVSRVNGKLPEAMDGFDLLRATFPAGTVSGAPKVRAMEIIEELEGTRRGPYAGAVGYFSFPVQGQVNLDFCITIRTIIQHGRRAYLQAGAGIVADSDPLREYQECLNKGQALAEAIRIAEEGL